MITEDYVSFEIALLLKEKGFNEITLDSYRANGQLRGEYKTCNYPCPTLQMAMKWLRKIYHIHIRLINSTDESYKFKIYPIEGKYKGSCITNNCYYDVYEQACEVALKYCLKNLI